MKTVFILNPEAGKKNNFTSLQETIRSATLTCETDVEIYITKAVGDATGFVRERCKDGEKIRFIACGGDGTLSEVLCGAMENVNAEIGVIPMGTGNDFCRNFSKDYDFASPEAQLCGDTVECDAIKYTTEANGKRVQGYCANMFNIGFDCNVADLTGTIKKKTPLAGSLAYFAAILVTLVRKKCTDLEVHLDGKCVHDGKLLLTSLANGCFCGGGIMSNPGASVDDGLINVNIINNVSRLRFISLLPYYMKGTHGSLHGIEKVITTRGAERVKIVPKDSKMRLCIDGEIIDAGVTEFEVVHNAFHFVLPQVQKSEGILSAREGDFMSIKDIIAQAFGLIGFFLMVYSYQEKDNKKFVMLQGVAGFAFFMNFILIGAISAALFNIVNFVRGFIFSKNDKKLFKLLSAIVLYLVCFVISLPAVVGNPLQLFLSTLTFFAILTMTFFMWKGNGKHIRYAQLAFGSPAWLIYDIFNFSLGGIMTEALSMASVVIALIRYGKNGFEEN